MVWVGEDGVEVREMVLTKVRTLKKSPDHDAHAVSCSGGSGMNE